MGGAARLSAGGEGRDGKDSNGCVTGNAGSRGEREREFRESKGCNEFGKDICDGMAWNEFGKGIWDGKE